MLHRFSKPFSQSLKPLVAVAALACGPLAAQAQTAPGTTQLWIDLSTSTMTGRTRGCENGAPHPTSSLQILQ